MQAQGKDHIDHVKALRDRVKDLQEGNARLDVVPEMQRRKLESYDDTWLAIQGTTVKHGMASEKKYSHEVKGNWKRTASECSVDEAEMESQIAHDQ
jgi:hypothetical protein